MFKEGLWQKEINVENFIKENYEEYLGDESFLKPISSKTKKIWDKCNNLLLEELKKGVIDIDTKNMSGIDNFEPGYIDKENEVIVGLQTDEPLKRIVNPYGGIRMVYNELDAYGYKLDENVDKYFNEYRKSHNQGVFDTYTKEIRLARSNHLLTGLPDAYGRGRIIGDYRRIALYGIDKLIQEKQKDLDKIEIVSEESIRLREEVSEQIRALKKIQNMASRYGFDISKPATNAKEAIQWLYFGYLAAIKENNGAAMSLGRTSTFLDIYIEKDIKEGILTEEEAQELIDQFIIKLRIARQLRTPEYNELFAGDPTWVTESIGGMLDNKSLVTKTSYRYLHTLINLGTAPEPNMTILWSEKLPENFKKYCAKISILTDAVQYENDDLMRKIYGSDYAIACCVSAMKIGHQMQFFGARCNLAKTLLYAINDGYDEITGKKVVNGIGKITSEYLNYDEVMEKFKKTMEVVAKTYVDAMNIIHYMHDKYAYEAGQMALHDTNVERLMAFGCAAGLSVAIDSLSAIKYANVKPIRNEEGIAIDFEIEGDFPKYGNDNDDVDLIGVNIVELFYNELKKHKLYRNAHHTLSVLTITSNVVYGKNTGATPDGRKKSVYFAPGANPMHGRDCNGALASLNSVAKIPYCNVCQDGISNTFSIVPNALGHSDIERIDNLVNILDGYFNKGAQHLNVNVLNRETLIDAMENPYKYPTLTIRVSGYAVNFNRLSKEQQSEVISRTFHGER